MSEEDVSLFCFLVSGHNLGGAGGGSGGAAVGGEAPSRRWGAGMANEGAGVLKSCLRFSGPGDPVSDRSGLNLCYR